AGAAPNGPEGGSRQLFRYRLERGMKSEREELLAILKETRNLMALPENDFAWSSWKDAEQALLEMDDFIAGVASGAALPKTDLSVLYAPTGPIQEVSLSSGWGTEFLALADRLETVMASL